MVRFVNPCAVGCVAVSVPDDQRLERELEERAARRLRDNEAERKVWAKRRNVKRPGPFPGRAVVEAFEEGDRRV